MNRTTLFLLLGGSALGLLVAVLGHLTDPLINLLVLASSS